MICLSLHNGKWHFKSRRRSIGYKLIQDVHNMRKPFTRQAQLGFSLIELMIAMTLSLVLIAMILSVFLSNAKNQAIRDAVGSIQENTRFAEHFFSRDIQGLGFWGCLEGGESDVTVLSSSGPVADQLNNNQSSLFATDGSTLGAANAAVYAPDSLSILSISQSSLALTNNMASKSADIETTTTSLRKDDEILIGDCERADLIKISKVTNTKIEHKNSANSSDDLSYAYDSNAFVYPINRILYSVKAGANGAPALFRQRDNEAEAELLNNVENMQILYGLSDADGNLLGYTPASFINPADFKDVISIRVSLLLTSASDILTEPGRYSFNGVANLLAGDKKMRRVFTSTYTLRNRIKR